MNVKPLTHLIYPVRLREKKEIKEAELVFQGYSWLQNIFGMYVS